MKSVLILPGPRPAVDALAETAPLGNLCLFGSTLAARWIEHLASLGAKEVKVIASDRPEKIRASVGDGSRWGVKVEVIESSTEMAVQDGLAQYRPKGEAGWLEAPHDVIVADTLPGLPRQKLFESYDGFFHALKESMPFITARGRVGLKQIRPGVWAGLRVHISDDAVLEAPCWLGDGVHIEKGAHVGPNAILEDLSWVSAGADVFDSVIAPETHLGVATSLNHSVAVGSTLIDWESGSVTKIADSFLLCSLRAIPLKERMSRMARRVAEMVTVERHLLPSKSFGLRPTTLH